MNLATRKALQPRKVKRFRQGVDARMLEELITRLINSWGRGVALQVSGTCDFAGEIVACVEELEETSYGVEIFVYEVDSSLLCLTISFLPERIHWGAYTYGNFIMELCTRIRKPGTCCK